MMRDPLPPPAGACSPDADRTGEAASARLPEWLVQLIAMLLHYLLRRMRAVRLRNAQLRAWCRERPDLEPGSAEHVAALIRGAFGNTIAWMCLYDGIGPGHREWPALSRAILAFGGSLRAFDPGRRDRPAMGQPWWGNPYVMPGLPAPRRETPAAGALAALLERDGADGASAAAGAAAPAPHAAVAPGPEPAAAPMPASWRSPIARVATGPPTGPHAVWVANFLEAERPGPEHGWPRRTDSCQPQIPVRERHGRCVQGVRSTDFPGIPTRRARRWRADPITLTLAASRLDLSRAARKRFQVSGTNATDSTHRDVTLPRASLCSSRSS